MRLCYDCGSPIPASSDQCPRCGPKKDEPADPLVGAIFTDKYEIEAKLGTGGMCDVYRARHIRIGKAVAIKILRPEFAADPKIAERFEGEARAASLVRHPNAINIMDYGVAGRTPFLVMELVEGATVRELLKRHGAMSVERVAGIVSQACGALESAHSVGVIHRDIKPENIIISEYDGRDWVEVVDFGIAKIQEDVSRRAALTGANLIIGTPRYMSPEQAEEQTVDARSDIYSFGIVVYEMLAGTPPFSGATATRLLIAHVVEPPPPLLSQRPDIQPAVAAVVMRALEKDPARRQQSAAEFAREFAEAVASVSAPALQATQTSASGRLNAPLSEVELANAGNSATLPLAEEDEETIVRRNASKAARAARPAAAKPTAPRDNRKRVPVALIAGLAAVVIVGMLVVYFTTRKNAPNQPAGQVLPAGQPSNDRAAASNANAGAASHTGAPPPAEPAHATATSPPPTSDAETQPTAPADGGKAVNQVRDAVSRWNASLEARNLNAHMSYYAPRLHTYFLKDNVDRNAARAEVADTLARYAKLKIRTSPLAISVDPSGNHAVVTFEKNWDFQGKQPWSGAAVERVWLDRQDGRWRITGVRDLKQLR
ncbi:MAG TPA: protein kinase [Blastocatellia bacterium]|nr:protein kinase [Blastocatellia bacterium]